MRPTSASRSGVGSSSSVSAAPRVSFESAGVAGPEVGHGGCHHQCVEPGSTVAADQGGEQRRAHLGGRFGADRRARRPAARTDVMPAISVTRAPRASAASAIGHAHLAGGAIADEADRVDRLGGAAGGHDDVTTLEVGRSNRGHDRRARCGIRLTHRPRPDRGDDRVDDPVEVGEPPDARLARGERSGLRLDHRVPELVPQPAHVRLGRRMRRTSRRPSPAPRRPAPPTPARLPSPRPRPVHWPSRRASGRSRARPPAHPRHRRARCGRSAGPAAARARPARPDVGSAPRVRAGRRSAPPMASGRPGRRRPRPGAGGPARGPCRPRSSR